MTYIELFDSLSINNICSAILKAPDKIIFLGDNKNQMSNAIKLYQEILGDEIEFEYHTAISTSLDSSISVLTKIIEENDECVFDITGGSDLFLVALGIVKERYPDKNIQMHRFMVMTGTHADCDGDGVTIFEELEKQNINPAITVEQNARLYGGIVKPKENPIVDDVSRETNLIWEVCKEDPQKWNSSTAFISKYANKAHIVDENPLRFRFTYKENEDKLANEADRIMKKLNANSMLSYYNHISDERKIEIEFYNHFVSECFSLVGKVLEMKIYYLAKNAIKDGKKEFNDVQVSVDLDWDGKIEKSSADTRNEIDVVMMKGLVPIFVSCKNGQIPMDELYKLNSVAAKFGGKIARKILVTNEIRSTNAPKRDSDAFDVYQQGIRNRAKEMGITIFENCHLATDEELTKAFFTTGVSRDFSNKKK